ncbi:MAG TPA: N-acetylmuramoyl-L-alanine amidase [Acidimicrobiales bacterium]|nr:N-acetylmuramoyl-L-alanine amidase [Acidimicrobiales bacterium]
MRRIVAVALVLAAACAAEEEPAARTTTTATKAPAPAPTTATTPPIPPLPAAVPAPEPRALVAPTGVVVPVLGSTGAGALRVRTPCGAEAVVAGGTPLFGATVVLDPGHGGDEPGALGPGGLREADLNLAVAERTADRLTAAGATVVLTRTTDLRVTLATRALLATRLGARALVSVHHNADPDGPSDRPGTEVWHQVDDPTSRRLAGLVQEEVAAAFGAYEGVAWQADRDAGAKARRRARGDDYYGVLRDAGVPAVISEALYLSNPVEAALLARPEVQQAEADALARAVARFLTTDDPGSGFAEAYPRPEGAGPGGGAAGCVDPPLS